MERRDSGNSHCQIILPSQIGLASSSGGDKSHLCGMALQSTSSWWYMSGMHLISLINIEVCVSLLISQHWWSDCFDMSRRRYSLLSKYLWFCTTKKTSCRRFTTLTFCVVNQLNQQIHLTKGHSCRKGSYGVLSSFWHDMVMIRRLCAWETSYLPLDSSDT